MEGKTTFTSDKEPLLSKMASRYFLITEKKLFLNALSRRLEKRFHAKLRMKQPEYWLKRAIFSTGRKGKQFVPALPLVAQKAAQVSGCPSVP